MTLTHLSLFSGIGGLDLAAEWALDEELKKWLEEIGKIDPGMVFEGKGGAL